MFSSSDLYHAVETNNIIEIENILNELGLYLLVPLFFQEGRKNTLMTQIANRMNALTAKTVDDFVFIRELSALSPGQKKILIVIAQGYTKELTRKIFLAKINMTSSSVVEAIKILEQRDYVEKKAANII